MDNMLNAFGDGFPEGTEGVGVDEASENKEIRNTEGVEYGEGDIERIETTADIMAEVFNDEVISNWENLSDAERTTYVNEYYIRAGQALGINTKGVVVADLYEAFGEYTHGVNAGNGYLGIDIRRIHDPSQLPSLLNTVTHEMRHQLQVDAIKNPDAFPDISKETLDKWNDERHSYIDPAYDFEDYESQAIETDARAYAEETVNRFLEEAGDGELAPSQVIRSFEPQDEIDPDELIKMTVDTKVLVEIGDFAEIEVSLKDLSASDLAELSKILDMAENTETSSSTDEVSIITKQGNSCGSGRGCMGSHSCGAGY